jgi:hypothetical protein
MAALKLHRPVFVFSALMLLVLPGIAAAQSSSTFIIPFDRTGNPGTELQLQPDPMNPEILIEVPVDFGAFVNPCTLENVDVRGASTITQLQTVDKFGTLKVKVSVATKGSGRGWVGADYAAATFTASTYSFSENQQFAFQLPSVGSEFSSDFTDKLSMKGARSTDNWTIRATFRIRVDTAGVVKIHVIRLSGDICRG